MDADDAVRPRAQASPGALASRRQKNLQKFRKHKEAQRHTLQAVVPSDVNSPVETAVAPSPKPKPPAKSAAVESAKADAVEENKPKEVVSTLLSKKKRYAKKKAAVRAEQAPKPAKPEPVAAVSTKQVASKPTINSVSKKDTTSKSAVSKPKSRSPVPPVVTKAQNDIPVHATEAPKSPAPHSNKRRSDIIRKLAKKNRGTSHDNNKAMVIEPIFNHIVDCEEDENAESPSQQQQQQQQQQPSEETVSSENAQPPLAPHGIQTTPEEVSATEISSESSEECVIQESGTKEELVQSMEALEINAESPLPDEMDATNDVQEEIAKVNETLHESTDTEKDAVLEKFESGENEASPCSPADVEIAGGVTQCGALGDSKEEASVVEALFFDAEGSSDETTSTEEKLEETSVVEALFSHGEASEAYVEQSEGEAKEEMQIAEDPADASVGITNSGFQAEETEMDTDDKEETEQRDIIDPSTDIDNTQPASIDTDIVEVPSAIESTVTGETTESDEKVEASDDTDACLTSTSFDLRSIHDFPPEPVKTADEALPSQDPSWDTAKVIFNEFEQVESSKSKMAKSDSVNMFDTTEATSWVAAESVTFSQDFQVGDCDDFAGFATETTASAQAFFGQEVTEEKKDADSCHVNAFVDSITTDPVVVEQAGSAESNVSPRRLMSRQQLNNGTSPAFGFDVSNLAMDSTDELDRAVKVSEEETGESAMIAHVGDDEGLLDEKVNDDSDHELWKNDSLLSKEERVHQYTSNVDNDGDNSSVGSSVQEEEMDDESLEDLPDVGYVSHSEEENDDVIEEAAASKLDDNMPTEIVADAPEFIIPAEETVGISPAEVAETQKESNEPAQDISADNSNSVPSNSAVEMEGAAVSEAPVVDPMQSVSHSSSGSSGESPVALASNDVANDGFVDSLGTKVESAHIGYISNSSSSDESNSTESDDQNINKVKTQESKTQEAETETNDNAETVVAAHSMDDSGSSEPRLQETANATEDTTSDSQAVQGDKITVEVAELEEAASLVGVSLVPSWGANASRKTGSSSSVPPKTGAGLGIPPRGNCSPSTVLPPPPPPPLSKKKKKKKKRKGTSSNAVPLLAPPPAEKFKKWEESKKRASVHFNEKLQSQENKNATASKSRGLRRPPGMAPINCKADDAEIETWEEPPESPGTVHIACGALPGQGAWASFPKKEDGSALLAQGQLACGGALAMAGLVGSPPKKTDPNNSSKESPVDNARSIALQNAMRRANSEGLAQLYSRVQAPAPAPAQNSVGIKSLLENEVVKSSSTSSSSKAAEQNPQTHVVGKADGVEGPPTVMRKQMSNDEVYQSFPDSPHAFLQRLTSPSLSMTSPTNRKDNAPLSPSSSPLIHDSKMAEKAALASYAAAVTFEEQYAASRDNNESVDSPVADNQSLDESNHDGVRDTTALPSLFCAPEIGENFGHLATGEDGTFFGAKLEQEITGIIEGNSELFKDLVTGSTPSRESSKADACARNIQDLKGGAFSPWKNAVYAKGGDLEKIETVTVAVLTLSASCSSDASQKSVTLTMSDQETYAAPGELLRIYQWLTCEVLKIPGDSIQSSSNRAVRQHLSKLLEANDNLNKLCEYVTDKINAKIVLDNKERAERNSQLSPRRKMKPFQIGNLSGQKSASVVGANFVSFLHRIARASETPSPFGEDNPFLLDLISTSIHEGNQEGNLSTKKSGDDTTMQSVVFRLCPADVIVKFAAQVCGFGTVGNSANLLEQKSSGASSLDPIEATRAANPSPTKKSRGNFFGATSNRQTSVPTNNGLPSPFECVAKEDPRILGSILDFLGDPACVSRLKMVNRDCCKYVAQNEHVLMRDAVRLGGLSMNLRPAFWLWVTLEKSEKESVRKPEDNTEDELSRLEEAGRTGKWHHVIQRDVARSFGNMPPHKTSARLRKDSIVRALVTWGTNRIMKRGVKGGGNPPPSRGHSSMDDASSMSDTSHAPTDTVSDWGGVSPVASFNDGDERNFTQNEDGRSRTNRRPSRDSSSVATDLLVLSGNALTEEMKDDLQNKLGFILHTLAATHEIVGYCQGMDYVVAHLLRILQDTIRWRAARGTLPASILSAPSQLEMQDASALSPNFEAVDKTLVVEETVFKVMDSLFTTYSLQHMYWPELRCLKTCCRVFERLIQLKLPVLADHFEHHELNVGLFALGWFQTLFLYLPSMPSATVCHMWDIWLVERSFKIFFRVGTAILFLSQPILLNHELEGMMTYLNTFPDATLLNPDILIACALQIKVTNKMLMEIEQEVCGS